MPLMPNTVPHIIANDDPHRAADVNSDLPGPTVPALWVHNLAFAQVQNEYITDPAQTKTISGRATPRTASKRGPRADAFAKYPIAQT